MDTNKIDVKLKLVSKFRLYQNDVDGNEEYLTTCDSLDEISEKVKALVYSYYKDARDLDDKMSEQNKMNYAFSQYLARPFVIKEVRTAIPEYSEVK